MGDRRLCVASSLMIVSVRVCVRRRGSMRVPGWGRCRSRTGCVRCRVSSSSRCACGLVRPSLLAELPRPARCACGAAGSGVFPTAPLPISDPLIPGCNGMAIVGVRVYCRVRECCSVCAHTGTRAGGRKRCVPSSASEVPVDSAKSHVAETAPSRAPPLDLDKNEHAIRRISTPPVTMGLIGRKLSVCLTDLV